ncbi:hypothetical protein DV738_g1720, partial [Chaetothyriales sp. CBS 135597]
MTSIDIHQNVPPNGDSSRKLYPQFILFGDSITQYSHSDLVPAVSEYYIRRLDVVNRGFSGYTAPMGLNILPRFFPTLSSLSPSTDSNSIDVAPHVRLMTVFFGANDACLPGQLQHVPLARYKQALGEIANHEVLRLHGTKLIFITPPPVDEHQLEDGNKCRSAENTALYAAACREVVVSLGLPFVDLWSVFMTRAGWKGPGSDGKLIGSLERERSSVLDELLSDGLHLTSLGYQLLWAELKALIESELSSEVPERLPMVYPAWSDVLASQAK